MANSALCIGLGYSNLDNFSHELEKSFHCQQLCQPAVVWWVTGLPHTQPYIMEQKVCTCIFHSHLYYLIVKLAQNPLAISSIDAHWRECFSIVPDIPQIQKFTEIQ